MRCRPLLGDFSLGRSPSGFAVVFLNCWNRTIVASRCVKGWRARRFAPACSRKVIRKYFAAYWPTSLRKVVLTKWSKLPVTPCAAVSIGTNPTFDGSERRVEAYVLDRDDLDLYGAHVALDFVGHIRGQVKFEGEDFLAALTAQMPLSADHCGENK